MLKIIKYLKKSSGVIMLVVGLLFIQAYCDLSLPSYTSDIVNIGIQQGGIQYGVPEVIRESEMNALLAYMSNEEKDFVLSQYERKQASESYQVTEPVYERKNNDEEVTTKLEDMFSLPIMIQLNMSEQSNRSKTTDIPSYETNIQTIKEQMESLPDMVISQAGVQYVKKEYTIIGLDLEKMQMSYIINTGAKMLLLALLAMVIAVTVAYLAARIAAAMSRDLRNQVFKKVVSFSNREFDTFSTASLITRSTNDIQQVQMLVVMLIRMVVYAPILAIGGLIKVLNTNTKMVWILGVAVGAIVCVVLVLFLVAMPRFKKLQTLVDRLNLVTREIITGIPVIRAFGTREHEEKRFDVANVDLKKTNLFVNRAMTFMMPTMMLIMNLVTVMIVWVGADYIGNATMQVGDMMAFIQYAMQIIMSFLMLTMISIMLPKASVSANRIDEVLKTSVTICDPKEGKEFEADKKGCVEFRNVSFRYPNAKEEVLHDITFTARAGQTTAIIGSTGSGKSTLIQLLPRFYDVTSGEILVRGVNVQKVKKHDLRKKIGYVPQKGVLFSGTIESNIKFSDEKMSEEQMIAAANTAQAQEFIQEKPDGYHSSISQGGTNVSGGQKQRLSIARAIAKKPEIYVFDDSFSALDYKTDVALRKALKGQTANSAVIIVAQRISTILHAEQIIVLEEGKIVGIGTHKELMKSCEVYQEIASSQLSKEELKNE